MIHTPPALAASYIPLPDDAAVVATWRPLRGELDLSQFAEDLSAAGDVFSAGDIIALTPRPGTIGGVSGRGGGNMKFHRIAIVGDLPDDGPEATKNSICIFRWSDGAVQATLDTIADVDHRDDASAGTAPYAENLLGSSAIGQAAMKAGALKGFEDLVGVGIHIGGDATKAETFPNNNKAANPDKPLYKLLVEVDFSRVEDAYRG